MTKPARILIVDDERHNRALLEVMLEPEGFVVAMAASGEEALALVAQEPPDLILLDVLMPGMGGFEVAGKLKGNVATKQIPIIMVTALDDRDARLFGLRAGAEDFLTRPLDRAELCVRVRNLLRLKAGSDGALAERDTSMGMVSHDLRNLLNGIVLQVMVLSREANESDEGRRAVAGYDRILGYTTRMTRLVEDLVDVVSIDAGKLALEPARNDVLELFRETVDASAHAATTQGIVIHSDGGDPTLVASFDRERMLQVLGNLVTNALKFTPRGGDVTLHGERIADELRLSVRDTGTGIPSHMLDAVFERFTQVGKHDHRGVGLGLYISKCIVESHGGRMWVESTVGEGSTFYFTIPDVVLSPRTSVVRVLIVDDDPSMGETLALWLNRRGFEATSRLDARDALTLLESTDFDVIVTDLNMHEMNGLALCERVVAMRPGLPVIVTTGFGGSESRAAAFAAGAYDFLTKPIDLTSLRLSLDRAVQGQGATNAPGTAVT